MPTQERLGAALRSVNPAQVDTPRPFTPDPTYDSWTAGTPHRSPTPPGSLRPTQHPWIAYAHPNPTHPAARVPTPSHTTRVYNPTHLGDLGPPSESRRRVEAWRGGVAWRP